MYGALMSHEYFLFSIRIIIQSNLNKCHSELRRLINKTSSGNVGFEVPTAVVTNVAIFWDIAPCSLCVWTDVSDELITSIFMVENPPSQLLHAGFVTVWFSTLNMEVISSSETSVHIRTARRCIPDDFNIQVLIIVVTIGQMCVTLIANISNWCSREVSQCLQ
jgi:hypothetical protein